MPSSHLILCHPLLFLPPIPPSIMRWPKYWSFSFSISPSKEHPGQISFRMDWLDLLAVQGTLKSLLQHHSSKASIKYQLILQSQCSSKCISISIYLRPSRVAWTARRSNQSILKEISPGCSLEGMMLKLKLQYLGHLMRRVDSLEKTLMLGGIGGRRRRG